MDYNGPLSGDFTNKGSISGNPVKIYCKGTWVYADVVSWDQKIVTATGNVLVLQEGLRVNAERAEIDRDTRLGTFYQAYGTARLTEQDKWHTMFGSMEPEVMFHAEKIERIGPRIYRLTNGAFSTCMQAKPRWEMTGSSATVTLDDHVLMKNTALRVKGVPVLYLPYMYYPLKKEDRSTGFLIPTYSASGVKGQGIGNAFFWAIDRSHDATFYYDWFSKSGQNFASEYRYAGTSGSRGQANFSLFDEKQRVDAEGNIERPAHRTYDFRGNMNQALPYGFRMVGNTNYTSDITTQQLYQQNVYEATRRDRNLAVALSGSLRVLPQRRLNIDALAEMRDYFNGATVARRNKLPQVNFRLDSRGLTSSGTFQKVYLGVSGTATYLDVHPNLSQPELDRSLWRVDGLTTVSAPLSRLDYLPVLGSATWRVTNWSETRDPVTLAPLPVPLTRNLFILHAETSGPKLERTFQTPNNGYADKFKHLIEPRLSIDWLSPFNELNRVIQIDPGIDSLVGGTTNFNYQLINRVQARAHGPNDTTDTRDLLVVVIGQSWYSNAQAGAIDPNYPTATINTFSPVRFSVAAAPTDDLGARFEMYIDPKVRAVRSYSASALLNPNHGEHLRLVAGWSKRQFLPNVPGYDNPNIASHFINGTADFSFKQGRYGGIYGFNYDLRNTFFLQQRIRGYYSAQCCGIAIDYQMMNVSQFALQGVPRDRRLAVTVTLAGIGAFSSPLGAFGR